MSPHLGKPGCDILITNQLIYGCGGPFQVKQDTNRQFFAEVCDYI